MSRPVSSIIKLNLDTALIIGIAAILILPIFQVNPYVLHTIILSLMFAIMAAGWSILAVSGSVSLGHAAFFGIGAYFTYFALTIAGLPSVPALAVAALASLIASLLMGYITFKFGISGIYFALVTIAFAEILRELFISLREITGGSLGVSLLFRDFSPMNFIFDSKLPYYYFIAIMFFMIYLLVKYGIKRFLRVLSVIGNDEFTAASMGINTFRYRMMALAVSSVLNSVVGWFYLHYFRYITPDAMFGLLTSVEIVVIGLMGGLNVIGTFFASLFLIPVGEMLRAALGGTYAGLNILIYGGLLTLIVLLRSKRIGRGKVSQ